MKKVKKTKSKSTKPTKKTSHTATTFVGKLDITPTGIGYFISESFPIDIKIPTKKLNGALPNDEVEIKLSPSNAKGRASGEVTRIVKRGQKFYTGKIHQNGNLTFFISEEPKCYVDFFIPNMKFKNLKPNQKVVMELKGWGDITKNPQGNIVELLDGRNEHDIAMKEIIIGKGFPLSFSDEVMNEAHQLTETLTPQDFADRRDMRDDLTFTIDPQDAKDFDDAISFTKLENNHFEIGIHIADVTHYIHPDTALDKEAYLRATSVYLPDRVIPMLPERISNELCSLRPLEDKRTFSVVVKMDANGKIKSQWIGKTLTHSNKRLTYEQAQEIIETKSGELSYEINTLDTIAKILRADRFKKGAINFSSEESGFIFDENKLPIGVKVKVSQDSHQLIEEYMLLANRLVSEFISTYKDKDHPKTESIYRIHDKPVEEKFLQFKNFATSLGYELDDSSPQAIARSFNKMLEAATGKPEKILLEQLGIRTMSKAEYSTDNIGHYGLAFQYYSHFTSPIRRYPDVLLHRLLQSCVTHHYQPIKLLATKAYHCSQQERKAQEAEREAGKYFQVYFMGLHIGEEFDGVISGVSNFGFWVETLEHKCEGLVSIKENFPDTQMTFKEESYMLQSEDGQTFQMGQLVRIKVLKANLDKRQLDFLLIST